MPLRVVLLFLLVAKTSADTLSGFVIVLIGLAVFKEPDDKTEGDFCTNILAGMATKMFPYLNDPGACWAVMLMNTVVSIISNGICLVLHSSLTGSFFDGFPLCESDQRAHCGMKSCACFWIFGAMTCCCMIDRVGGEEVGQAKAGIVGIPVRVLGQSRYGES